MTDFTPWLRPTLFGPFLTTWSFATLAHLVAGALVLPNGERLDGWLLSMLLMSFFGAACVVGLLLADVALLRTGLRQLPTHGRAWLSALLAPVGVYAAWMIFGLGDGESIPQLVFSIGAPFVLAPLALRFALGQRP